MLYNNSDHQQSGLPAYSPAELPRCLGAHLNDGTATLSTADRDTLPAYDELSKSDAQCPAARSSAGSECSTTHDEKAALAMHYGETDAKHISRLSTSSASSAAPKPSCSALHGASGPVALQTTKANFLAKFLPTVQLQIQTGGKQWLSSPFPPRAEPIPVFPLVPIQGDGAVRQGHQRQLILSPRTAYVSLRPSRDSRSTLLMTREQFAAAHSREETNASRDQTQAAGTGPCPVPEIGSITYRSSSIYPPVVAMLGRGRTDGGWYRFRFYVQDKGIATRAVEFEPRCFLSSFHGGGVVEDKFTWRYAGNTETVIGVGRFLDAMNGAGSSLASSGKGKSRDKPARPNSVLVLERAITTTTTVTTAPATVPVDCEVVKMMGADDKLKDKASRSSFFSRFHKPKTSKEPTGPATTTRKHTVTPVVALFVRSDELRSPGSSASSAGNGGRLFIDLQSFRDGDAFKEHDHRIHDSHSQDGSMSNALDNDDDDNDDGTPLPDTAQPVATTDEKVKGQDGAGSGPQGDVGLKYTRDTDFADHRELAQRIVVATALVMLKREVDRRRTIQIGALTIGIAGL